MIKQVILVNLFAIIIFWKITSHETNSTLANYEHADFSEILDLEFVKQNAWYSGLNASLKNLASFSTSFSFQIITTKPYPEGGSSLLFFISDYNKAPKNSYGRYLGMVKPVPDAPPSPVTYDRFSTQFNPSGEQSNWKTFPIPVCVIGGAICGLILLRICFFCIKRWKKTGPDVAPAPLSSRDVVNPVPCISRYTLQQLKRATHRFAKENKIGEGGYSVVYKGALEDGSIVAVKKLKKQIGTEKQESEFLAELQIISDIRHRHLLPLQGWCYESGEAIFVYMYMTRGSLDTYLYGRDEREILLSDTRYGILAGVASALEYLHFGLGDCVLHRDVKAANVLLTEEFEPLLGDFGLARRKKRSQEGAVTMTAAGTTGYVAPEVVFQARFSDKSDVYGFGVLALEVACGRRAIDERNENMNEVRLVEWVGSLHMSDRLIDALDSRMSVGMSPYQEEQWRGVLHLALLCCSPEPEMRPSMRQIAQTLQGDHSVFLTQPLPRIQRAYTLSIGP